MPARIFASVVAALLFVALGLGAAARPDDAGSQLESSPQGWIDLLEGDGAEVKGWTRVAIPPKSHLREASPWSFDRKTGVLTCDGRGVHEWLRFDQEAGDFVYHVEWRFVPVTTGKKAYNSGVYVRNSADGAIWHQAQTGDASGGYLFAETKVDGTAKRVNLSKQVKSKRVKPAGEWNAFELTCKGREVSLWVNGAVSCVWSDCEIPKGFVGLEAEGYAIEFRNVKLKK